MKQLVTAIIVLVANYASAATLHCLPAKTSSSAIFVASEASINLETHIKDITLVLKDGRSVSGPLIDAEDLGPGALSLSQDVAQEEGFTATVVPRVDLVYLLVSPISAMSIPQQFICK